MINLPKAFSEYMIRLLGQDAYERLENGLTDEPQVSVRLNRKKLADAGFCLNQEKSVAMADVPWCRFGFYLTERPSFTFDPLFHAGAYYVQEAGSMFLEQAFAACMRVMEADNTPLMALDLCAAPGGKSTHLRSLLPEGSFLVSNEPVRSRAQILVENMQKWGDPACMVTNGYPADFSPLVHLFDLIVADVPCSGEGMFRKDEGAITEWSPENVVTCWQRQRTIISEVWPALKSGGCLIYSTCTFNQYEDEENVAWIAKELGADVVEIPVAEEWQIMDDLTGKGLPVYHFLPGWTRGEGFFLAVLRKKESLEEESLSRWESVASRKSGKKNKTEKKNSKNRTSDSIRCSAVPDKWLSGDDWEWFQDGGRMYACPSEFSDVCTAVKTCLPVLYYGIPVAEQKGHDWIPMHALALNRAFNSDVFPKVTLDYQQAIAYLRKESLVLPEETPKGYVLLTYRGFSLGFAKQIGNRANNLYPDTWRIRSGYVTRCELL